MSALLLLASCDGQQQALLERARELCRHIPDTGNLELSEGYLTEEYYSALEEMLNLPDSGSVLHEWEFWFVAADGSAVRDDGCEVLRLERTGLNHATAIIRVQPSDPGYPADEHTLSMQKVKGEWLLSDYDGTLQAARRRISAGSRPGTY